MTNRDIMDRHVDMHTVIGKLRDENEAYRAELIRTRQELMALRVSSGRLADAADMAARDADALRDTVASAAARLEELAALLDDSLDHASGHDSLEHASGHDSLEHASGYDPSLKKHAESIARDLRSAAAA